MLAMGLIQVRDQLHVHSRGQRVIARIAAVSRAQGRYSSSSTSLTFSTPNGGSGACNVGGILGEVGHPVWIRYLPSDPSQCGPDALMPTLSRSFVLLGIGTAALIASFLLYRRAQRGESVRAGTH
jgi:hypothetical protein